MNDIRKHYSADLLLRGVHLHFPYRNFQERLDASPSTLGKSIMMRCPQYDRRVIQNHSIDYQEEKWAYIPVEKYIQEIDPNIIERYGEQKEYNGNEEFTGVDHGVRFLNLCNNDANPIEQDEEEYKNKPLAWWYPASVPVNTMPSDECWDEVFYVDLKLAPYAFKNEYVLEALDKFFNNKQPVKTFHVCNEVSSDYMNWIEDNQDTWNDFIKHSHQATKKGYIHLEVYMYYNRLGTSGFTMPENRGVINVGPNIEFVDNMLADAKNNRTEIDEIYSWALKQDPTINKQYIENINFKLYDHIDYMHCITHLEKIYFNLKNYHWPVDGNGVYIKNSNIYYREEDN